MQNKYRFVRTYEVAKDYEMRKKRASKYYEERLVSRLFGSGNPFIIERNLYPYKGEFAHWLIWINPKYTELDMKKIRSVARMCFRGPVYSIYENPEYLRSIKSIRHFHAFTDTYATLNSTYTLLPS